MVDSQTVETNLFTVGVSCGEILPHVQRDARFCLTATGVLEDISLGYTPFESDITACPVSFDLIDVATSVTVTGSWISVDPATGIIKLDRDTPGSKTVFLKISTFSQTLQTSSFSVTVSGSGTRATMINTPNFHFTIPAVTN